MAAESTLTKKEVAHWTRWLHIYLSMFSFAALLFFAVTGITLNHPEWIGGQERVTQLTGQLNTAWISQEGMDKLAVVEQLRSAHGIKARVSDFAVEETELRVSFKGPGYSADVFVDRASGTYDATVTEYGLIAVMNDLHKGRDSGTVWGWLIDVSAVLMIVVSITGFIMLYFLRRKRLSGTILALVGTAILVVLYYMFAK
jgi:uncharacterized protein